MDSVYIDSAAVGANNGTSKADAYTSAVTALAAWVNLDIHYISHLHAETGVTLQNTSTNHQRPFVLISMDFSTDLYREGAADQLVNVGDFRINVRMIAYGVYFRAGNNFWFISACKTIQLFDGFMGYTHNTGNKGFLFSTGALELNNVKFQLGIAPGTVTLTSTQQGTFVMRGGVLSGQAHISGSFGFALYAQIYRFIGVDASSYVMGNYLVKSSLATSNGGEVLFEDCIMPTYIDTSLLNAATSLDNKVSIINSNDSGTLDDINVVYADNRTLKSNRTIYLDSGFEQFNTGVKQSHAMLSKSFTTKYNPMFSYPMEGFIKTTGAKTFTVEFVHDHVAPIQEGELVLEVMAKGTAGTTLYDHKTQLPVVTNTLFDPIGASSNIATSVAAWTGASGLTKQKVSLSLTINIIGTFTARLVYRKYAAGKTVYYNPIVDVT